MNTKKYNVIELFAGAGGLALGLEQAGFNTKITVEINKWATKTRHPSYPIKDSLQCCRCDHVAQMMIYSCDTVTPTKSNKFKV